MTVGRDQWDGIPYAASGAPPTERRADPDHPLDFFRGRDAEGRHAFILRLQCSIPLDGLPLLGGIEIRPRYETGQMRGIVMVLTNEAELSIFRAFTEDLLQGTSDLEQGEEEKGARRVMNRIVRWHDMLKRRKDNVLSRQAIIGLVGELMFLRDILLPRMSAAEAMACWRGPHSDEQDFAIGKTIVEIKTQRATADQVLKISSEAQLDTTSGPIVLCHQTLSQAGPEGASTFSLNDLVEYLRSEARKDSAKATDLFEAGLLGVQYETRDEYGRDFWQPAQLHVYEVLEGFPRLVPSDLPEGIRKVRYEIQPSVCAGFLRELAWLEEMIDERG